MYKDSNISESAECYLTDADGNRFNLGKCIPNLTINKECVSDEVIHRINTNSFSGSFSFKLSNDYIRRCKASMKIVCENDYLRKIYYKTKKFRIRKKLTSRVIKNIYAQHKIRLY